jgi:hypothetical protein
VTGVDAETENLQIQFKRCPRMATKKTAPKVEEWKTVTEFAPATIPTSANVRFSAAVTEHYDVKTGELIDVGITFGRNDFRVPAAEKNNPAAQAVWVYGKQVRPGLEFAEAIRDLWIRICESTEFKTAKAAWEAKNLTATIAASIQKQVASAPAGAAVSASEVDSLVAAVLAKLTQGKKK